MKVRLKPAAGSVLKITTKNGEVLTNDDVKSVEVTPFFSMANGPGEILVGESLTEDNDSLDKFTMVASGANGKVKRGNKIESSVVPLVDKKKSPPKPVTTPANPVQAASGKQEGNAKK